MSSDVRRARQGAEDGFHEIQLSGKQLVFLFMATTAVSIVIFLCGVLVGRGARVEATPATDAIETTAGEPGAPAATPSTGEPVVDSSAPAQGAADAPAKAENSDFNYMQMLTAEQSRNEVPQPPAENESGAEPPPAEAKATPEPTPATGSAGAAAPSPTPTSTAGTARAAASGGALTIQVAALKERGEADRIAKRLERKGYDAYVADPAPGTSMYRVRVGHFSDRSEAEKVKARLAKEEKFRPWVTR
jgi:cell division septation protein DedD